MRQPQNKLVRVGRTRGADDLKARGAGLAVGDVFGDGAKEQKRLLQHQTNVAPVVGHGKTPDIGSVHLNSAIGDVIKTADQIDQRAFSRTAVAHQTNHFAGLYLQVQPSNDGTVAVPEAQALHVDAPLQRFDFHGLRRLGHVRDVVKNVKDALGTGSRFLRDRNNPAHRVKAAIEPANVGNEGCQHAHCDLLPGDQPDAKRPDHQQADFGQQRDRRRKQRPGLVELVIDHQVVMVDFAKTLRFALFLGEGLDHANAWNRVGQHIGHVRPDPVDLFKARAQFVAYHVNHPSDKRQRQQRHQREPRIDRKQNDGRHDDHQHVGGEVQRVQRQKHADAVGLGTDAGHQVARALGAEIVQRQVQQVVKRGRAQVRAYAFRHQRQ